MREYELEALVVALGRARKHAVKAEMDLHFISDIDHLTVVAMHNREELKKNQPKNKGRNTMALRLNYLDENGDLRYRPLRNCDLFTHSDPREAAAHAKWAFNKDCPSAQTNGRNYWRQMVDWLLSPVRDGYAPKTEGGEA